jgi:death-on-curing protein
LKFLTDQQVANVHEILMARDGGLAGYREGASLSAVLERVRNLIRFGGDTYTDPVGVAAMTTFALTIGYPFNDGNKRTALACGLIVLQVNGHQRSPDSDDLARLIVEAASGNLDQSLFLKRYRALC